MNKWEQAQRQLDLVNEEDEDWDDIRREVMWHMGLLLVPGSRLLS